jgi:hypothetical protein
MLEPVAVASAASSTALCGVNTARKGLIIENSDANRLYVSLGIGAATTTTGFSFSLAQNENAYIPNYKGKAYGIWAADGSGYALVSEL